ncbi:hypothetical protein NDJ06_01190 [Vibrio alginolyticus]|uniref:hypothetical protein n=1 Tax=Vibrio TaxID=662 RepID=UPI00215E2350|nr:MULTISPECIES: hypothetical protein [Vibrio]MCS0183927.1 hypothetical protein [Vibrio alginolyticus]MDW1950452.1 hypothetical protein [Vibrio sp. 812(2023)]MDW1991312.1 hypothetical protein [Vibrio sp. 780]
MVHIFSRNGSTTTQTLLTQILVTLEDDAALLIPLTAITTLMSVAACLMNFPSSVTMLVTVARLIEC